MSLIETAYGRLLGAARVLSPVLGVFRPVHAGDLAERRSASALMGVWARAERRTDRPLVWVHGPSAGELLGAEPALEVLRRQLEFQLAVTFTSASARPVIPRLRPDYAGLAPVDSPGQCRSAIQSLRPSAIVFAKLDVWPGLTGAAAALGVPLGLINGTVRPDSSRLRPLSRRLLRPAYARLERAGAATEADRERLLDLGVSPASCVVTGDAAFDLALQRVAKARTSAASAHHVLYAAVPAPGPRMTSTSLAPLRIVAGSTWPADEDALLEAAASLRQTGVPVELVLVPHQPTPSAVGRLQRRCRETLGEDPDLWSGLANEEVPARRPPAPLIVDRVGVLAELYLAADVAYVGGGLDGTGLHSVIEPAAADLPVLFGPRHSRREASDLLRRGAAREVDATSAVAVLRELAEDPAARRSMGERARTYVEDGAGAASASAGLIADLISGR